MVRKRTFKSREEAVKAMARIIKREVRHYLVDWSDYDEPAILNPEKTAVGETYIWITRESGTHLFLSTSYDFIRAVIECWGPSRVHVRQVSFFEDRIELEILNPEKMLSECIKELKKQADMQEYKEEP